MRGSWLPRRDRGREGSRHQRRNLHVRMGKRHWPCRPGWVPS
jgi:hypothetical protein